MDANTKFWIVSTPWLNLRLTPNLNHSPITSLPQGLLVEKTDQENRWYQVKALYQGKLFTGWLSSNYLQALPPFDIDSNLKERPSPLTITNIDQYLQQQEAKFLEPLGMPIIEASQTYGINATYILAHAILETGWGKSAIYQKKHNLFGWNAVDASPGDSARTFNSDAECIDYVMSRVNQNYLTPGGKYYQGSPSLGNKHYGMNVKYASDAEWGLKIAKIARSIEAAVSLSDGFLEIGNPAWYEIALAEKAKGIREIRGRDHHPRILEYHRATTLAATDDETSWCSSFVNWCFQQADFPGTNSAAARSWLNWGQPLTTPKPGCVVVLWRESPNSWKGHVGFYAGEQGNSILVLGGNQSDGNTEAVNISPYPKSRLLGYRWIDS